MRRELFSAFLATNLFICGAAASQWYISTGGTPSGSGAITSPWDIVTGLKGGNGKVLPGDTVWLRGGTYGDSRGVFYNTTVGTLTAPIIFRAYPGERATIRNWLQVGCCDQSAQPSRGAYTWFWGLEFANNITDRTGGLAGPPDYSAAAVSWLADTWGPGTKFINNVFHDGKQGPALWHEAYDAEAYGNLIYDNGYKGPDRGHGHGIYVQGLEGVKKLYDNFIFNQWGYGIHGYGSGSAYVQNLDIRENIVFNNGLPGGSRGDNVLVTGGQGQSGIKVTGNHFYNPVSATSDGYNELSWGTGNQDLTVTGNFFVGGRDPVDIGGYSSVVFTGNTVYGNSNSVNLKFGLPPSLTLDNNSYFGTGAFGYNGGGTSFAGWKNSTHRDTNSTYTPGPPAGLQYFIYPNRYEPGRANMVVYNWDQLNSVQLNIGAAGLANGQTFEIRDAQNFYGSPVLTGTFSGQTVLLRMSGLPAAPPNGVLGQQGLVVIPPHTGPVFGTFVILPTGTTPGAPSFPPPTVAMTAPAANAAVLGTITLSANATAVGSAVISWVQFQVDGVNVGAPVTSAPYSIQWNTALAANGVHQIRAVVSDTFGQQATSATVSVSWNNPVLPVSALFVGLDANTKGSWKGFYGQDGYIIANDSNVPPSYATIVTAGASLYTWNPYSSDIRALQKGGSSTDRIASTFYGNSSFTFDVNITDGGTHQLALYLLDWDSTSRAQTITILNAADNSVLSTQQMANLNGGVYAIWNLRGHVIVKVTYGAGWNAVVNGLFFGPGGTPPVNPPPPPPPPPTVSLSSPSAGTVSGSVVVSATASSTVGLASVQFQLDGANLGSAIAGNGPSFSTTWNTTTAINGSHTLTAIATDTQGQKTTSAATTVTVSNASQPPPPPGSIAANFVGLDLTTRGTWKGIYGQGGYIIANDSNVPPAYASVLGSGLATWSWDPSSSQIRSLQKGNSTTDRIASTFYSTTSFAFDINITDGTAHQLALYFLDWDTTGRAETVTILNATNNAVLSTQQLSNLNGGVYAIWNVQGHVIVRVTYGAGLNAVLSAIFFGNGASSPPSNPNPPVVSIASPAAGTVSGPVTLTAAASSTVGLASVQFQLDGANLGSPIAGAGPSFSMTWNTATATNGPHTLTAVATDTQGTKATSTGVAVTVSNVAAPPGSSTATFVGIDVTTRGAWKALYGQDGYAIAYNGTKAATYGTLTPVGALSFKWADTPDLKALEPAGSTTRSASTYYAATGFTIDVNLTDNNTHQLALYLLDWDSQNRIETISLLDAATQQVLDSRSASEFQYGSYYVWNVKGHVTVQVAVTRGTSAVISGAFLGPLPN